MITFSPAGRPLPGGYTVGRSPVTGRWIVRRLGTIVSNSQPDDATAAAFARVHGELYPVPELTDEQPDDEDVARVLRQHRREAQEKTGP